MLERHKLHLEIQFYISKGNLTSALGLRLTIRVLFTGLTPSVHRMTPSGGINNISKLF